ncbi:MAG: ABC transporter ATP-binding protein [Paludisphaera borealis]|uniref:ABC transporter ATP-binding protein n=1 Tax=Paludisphaera borealis TaxID=1387353 RepID=UPI00284684A1|nr:ABC transporter ATP-binding protein [Paludisphaera borealis]MDR3622310.1 ABC transporter ATP-binding protein [Paludisphaera borealis]
MDAPALIATENLSKAYGGFFALRDLSLNIRQGEVFGLLGPNGSGKTTTIRLLLGLLRPSEGRATVVGFDCWRQSLQVRRLVSYLPGELRMTGSMSGLGVLKYLSGLREDESLDRAVAIAEQVMKLNLRRSVRKYSTGMKQKLALAQAFADPVDILILDEPTSALDPSARADVLTLIREARGQGQTVIFSGHVLSEIEAVCDRVAILRLGRLVHVEDMHARRRLRMLLIRFAGDPPATFPEELELTVREPQGAAVLLEHRGPIGPLLRWLATVDVEDVAIGTEDLHSLYNQYHGPDVVVNEDALS